MQASHTSDTAARSTAAKKNGAEPRTTAASTDDTAAPKGLLDKKLTILPGVGLVAVDDPRVALSLASRLAGTVQLELAAFASQMREGLLAASVAIGLQAMAELMEAEVTDIVGPKGRHDPVGRKAYRHGAEDGSVVLGGRLAPLRHPRVRTTGDAEVHLSSYETFQSADLLCEHTVAAMLAGLSTRRYTASLEPLGDEVSGSSRATSSSAVSRRFVALTTERLGEFRSCELAERFVICFLDGFDFADHTMIGALGVTADGTKVPLGVVEGSTENASVVRGLVTSLRDRGLDASGGVLFVLDGGKALHRAVKDVFGQSAVIQRCRLHKERNVADHLPEPERASALAKMRAAWANPDAQKGEAAMRALATQLDKINPDAAGSLREGLAETFTVNRLKVTGSLLKTVFSTNPVESMIEIVRDRSRNVKRWRDGNMRLRWAAAGMQAAAGQFRRVKGYSQLPKLAEALRRATAGADGACGDPADQTAA